MNPKGGALRCYFGVSPRKITIMDEKTKVSLRVLHIQIVLKFLQYIPRANRDPYCKLQTASDCVFSFRVFAAREQ